MNYPDFLVYIDCITYNHASYIEDAMNGFCMQETTFPFVAAIIDDASTDGEQNVIKRYLEENFDFSEKAVARKWETDDAYFIYAQHKTNKNCYFAVVLLKYNFYQLKKDKKPLISEWTDNTKYVAFCEGDDYWTKKEKLQTQVDFLEQNPNFSMCFHTVDYIKNKEVVDSDKRHEKDCSFSVEDLIIGGGLFCATCSLLMWHDIFKNKNGFRAKADIGDFPLQISCALQGKVQYFSNTMGCYRVQTPGGWSDSMKDEKKLSLHVRNEIYWLQELNDETHSKYQSTIFYRIAYFSSFYLERGMVSMNEFMSFFDKIHFWQLKRRYIKSYSIFYIRHKHKRLYHFMQYKNLSSLVFLISPKVYKKYIKMRTIRASSSLK